MNEILFSEGGQPISLDDIKTLQESALTSIQAFASILPDGVYGKVYYSDPNGRRTLRWEDSIVIARGKVGFLPKGSMPYNLDTNYYAAIVEEEGNAQEFADGSSHPTRKTTKVIVTDGKSSHQYYAKMQRRVGLSLPLTQGVNFIYEKEGSFATSWIGYYYVLNIETANTRIIQGQIRGTFDSKEEYIGIIRDSGLYQGEDLLAYDGGATVYGDHNLPIGTRLVIHKGKVYLIGPNGARITSSAGDHKIRFTIIRHLDIDKSWNGLQ